MRRVTLMMAAGLVLLGSQQAQAFDEKGGNALWGKYAIQTCRTCHKEKGLSNLAPEERSAEDWNAIFANRYQKLRDLNHDFSIMGMNDRQLENIHRYLVEDAGKKESEPAPQTAKTISPTAKKAVPVEESGKQSAGGGDVAVFNPAAGDAIRGRYVFRKCLTCHKKNNASVISPADRTKAAWDRFFTPDFKKFKKEMPKFETYGFSATQMEDLHQFVLQYALDADHPKTCE